MCSRDQSHQHKMVWLKKHMFRDQSHQHKDWLKNNYMFKRSISSAEDGLAKGHLHVQEIMLISIMLVDWAQNTTLLIYLSA